MGVQYSTVQQYVAETHPFVWADGQRVVPLGMTLLGALAGLIGLLGAQHPFVVQVPGKGGENASTGTKRECGTNRVRHDMASPQNKRRQAF